MKGKIPLTDKIEFESDESQWRMLVSGLINELKTSGIVKCSQGKRVRIQLTIKEIIPPEYQKKIINCVVAGNMNKNISSGYERIHEYVMQSLYDNSWIFYGFISGDKNKPIVINYFPSVNLAVYSQKLKKEELESFVLNHHLN